MNTIKIHYCTVNIIRADASVTNAAMASSGMILNYPPEITLNTPPQGLTANLFFGSSHFFWCKKLRSEASHTISSLLINIICYLKFDAPRKPKIQHA